MLPLERRGVRSETPQRALALATSQPRRERVSCRPRVATYAKEAQLHPRASDAAGLSPGGLSVLPWMCR
jgi:hypothetical protein